MALAVDERISVRPFRDLVWITSKFISPPFSTAGVEAICKELAEHASGSQITRMMGVLKYEEPAAHERWTKWKRLYNAVAAKQNAQNDGRPLIALITAVMEPARFEGSATFEKARIEMNKKLLLYGFSVRTDGRVGRAKRAETIADAEQRADVLEAELRGRNVHPRVLAFCREELLRENYFHAVLEATKSIADRIREMTALEKDGTALIDEATSLKEDQPILAFNELQDDSQRSEHSGLAMLAKGLFASARNPTAHAPKVKWAIDMPEALDLLTIASMLHRRLDSAIV